MIKVIVMFSMSLLGSGFVSKACAELYVTTTSLERIAQPVELTFSANVKPKNVSQLSAGIGSKIIETTLEIGDSVRTGEVIAQLDCRDAELRKDFAQQALEQTKIQLEFARRQADRIQKLADTKIASEEVRDTRVTDVTRAEISLKSAETASNEADLMVSRCQVTAPFDAIVQDQLAFVGTQVSIGTPIYQIASEEVNVHANIPFDLKLEEQATFVFEYGDLKMPMHISRISRSVNNQTGTRLVRLTPRNRLDPGVPGVIKILSSQRVLPADYLVERDSQFGFMSLIDMHAVFIPRPRAILGQPIDVSDLTFDTEIIVEGRFRAQHGDALVVSQ